MLQRAYTKHNLNTLAIEITISISPQIIAQNDALKIFHKLHNKIALWEVLFIKDYANLNSLEALLFLLSQIYAI